MPASPPYPGAPRWVKTAGVVTLVLLVAFVALHLAGGGHSPMSHLHAMGLPASNPPAVAP